MRTGSNERCASSCVYNKISLLVGGEESEYRVGRVRLTSIENDHLWIVRFGFEGAPRLPRGSPQLGQRYLASHFLRLIGSPKVQIIRRVHPADHLLPARSSRHLSYLRFAVDVGHVARHRRRYDRGHRAGPRHGRDLRLCGRCSRHHRLVLLGRGRHG